MSDPTTFEGAPLSEDAEPAAGPDQRSAVEVERDEYLATLQRLQADFENYRKRVARAAEDAASRATGALVTTLLPVLDAFDLAASHLEETSDEGAAFARRAIREGRADVNIRRHLVANLAAGGSLAQARQALAELRESVPSLSVTTLESMVCFWRKDDRKRYVDAFRVAGLA